MPARAFLLGVDVGSGSVRALLLDPEAPAAPIVAQRRWTLLAGESVDLEQCWRSVAAVVRDALARAGEGASVLGIAISGVRFGTAILDGAGETAFVAGNRDARAAGAAFGLAASHGEELHRRGGHWPTPILPVARAAWLRDTDPTLLGDASAIFALNDWIVWRACGVAATDATHAGATGAFDLAAGAYAEDWLREQSLVPDAWAELRPAGSPVGELTPDAAEMLGCEAGIPVASAGGDSQAALLGLGALEPDDVAVVCGTTAPVLRCVGTDDPFDEKIWRAPHLVPETWVRESNAGTVGESLAWLGALLFPDAPLAAARLLAEAESGPAGADGFLSTFGAQRMDARGLALPTGDLTLSHLLASAGDARARLCRAVVEGLAFAIDRNLEQTAPQDPARPLRVGGGMARSRFWSQLLGAATGRPVLASPDGESTGRGAALSAGVAAGVWPDLRSAAEAAVVVDEVPLDAALADVLAPVRTRWRGLVEAREAHTQPLVQGHAIQALLSGGAASGATAPQRPLRILATAQLDPIAVQRIEALGELRYENYREVGRLLQGDALVEALADTDVFITEIDLVDAVSLGKLPALKVVVACRGDAVNLDVEACARLGIPALHTPGRNAAAVADLTLAFLLALSRKLPAANAFLRDPSVEAGNMGSMGKAYGTLRGDELGGRTVGLVGLGAVGRGVAARLVPFGARVLVSDPFVDDATVVRAGATPCPLDRLLAESDLVSLHAAVSDETRGLMDDAAIASMKPGAALVNTARAALVDEEALVRALEEGRLSGAALDVFNVEPPGADHPLLAFEQVIATPHVGGNTAQVAIHQGRIVAEQLEALLAGRRPQACLDPEVLEGFAWDAPPRSAPDAELQAWLDARPAPAVTDLKRDEEKKDAPAPDAPRAVERPAGAPEDAIAALTAVLDRFLVEVSQHDALTAVAAGQDLTLHFQVTDLGIDWYLRFRGGEAGGAVRVPDAAAVQLRMAARTLDGMLGGSVNAAQEAMAGRIAFSGDATQAMVIQQCQGALEEAWCAARETVAPELAALLPDIVDE